MLYMSKESYLFFLLISEIYDVKLLKVVFAFMSFCRRWYSNFFCFSLLLGVLFCFEKMIASTSGLNETLNCVSLPVLSNSRENSISPKMQIRPCCIHIKKSNLTPHNGPFVTIILLTYCHDCLFCNQ